MAKHLEEGGRAVQISAGLFEQTEHAVYIVLGVLLSVTAILALGSAGLELWHGIVDWGGTSTTFLFIDRLLLVLMLVEILHTVRASMRSGALTCEPFLVVGLIASIRRVLVITLESSEATHGGHMSPEEVSMFQWSMTELGVLGAIILILVLSIYLLQRGNRQAAAASMDQV